MTGGTMQRLRRALTGLGIAGVASAAAFAASLAYAPYEVVPFATVRADWRSSDAWLLDRQGEPLAHVRIDKRHQRGDWAALQDVSPALVDAVLAAEDRRFRAHRGVDWLGMLASFRDTGAGGRRGGSTVTMQLAGWLHPEIERSGQRNLLQKWRQMRQALAIERQWSKEEVLEAWLNLTPFRGEVEGIDAAARALMGKRASGLGRAESALLAALVRSPNAAPGRVARRACALLENDAAACAMAQSLATTQLGMRRLNSQLEDDAPHLARKLLAQAGERKRSTLDARTQRFAAETLERHLRELDGRNVQDGALVVLDNATGEVLAWIGSSGSLSDASEVDGVTAPRQPGSTLKPFLYALAIEERLLTAASILDDTPVAVTTPAGLYVPQNYDHSFRGRVSLRTALAGSLNVPAVRTLALVGYEPFYQRLRVLGFDSLTRDADHYGYSLALGGGDVTLLALTNAYRTLANQGRVSRVRVLPDDALPEMERAVDPRAAYIVSDILADSAARATTFGMASPLTTRYSSSVKTGTSTDMRDNWAIGFSTHYTLGVWVGNFSGEPMHDVSGVSGAAPIWRDVMDFLHEGRIPAPPAAPAGLVQQTVRYANAEEPERQEWFVAGTETQAVIAIDAPAGRPRIVSPAQGALLALDPDIPRGRQRVAIRTAGAPLGAQLLADAERAAAADEPYLWSPSPGRHDVRLIDAKGKELDRVQVTVRGLRLGRRAQ